MKRPDHIVNTEGVASGDWKRGDRYEARCSQLAKAAGAKKIGCMLYEVPKGKQCFPYHSHRSV